MEGQNYEEIWKVLSAEESKDVSELEDATSQLDERSRWFTEAMTAHSLKPISFSRRREVLDTQRVYVGAFSRFADVINRDPFMVDSTKHSIIAKTMLSEEELRLRHIETLLQLPPQTIERTVPLDLYEQLLKAYFRPPVNDSTIDSLTTVFSFMARRDTSTYFNKVIQG